MVLKREEMRGIPSTAKHAHPIMYRTHTQTHPSILIDPIPHQNNITSPPPIPVRSRRRSAALPSLPALSSPVPVTSRHNTVALYSDAETKTSLKGQHCRVETDSCGLQIDNDPGWCVWGRKRDGQNLVQRLGLPWGGLRPGPIEHRHSIGDANQRNGFETREICRQNRITWDFVQCQWHVGHSGWDDDDIGGVSSLLFYAFLP
jgi:hypothetical protein